MGALIVPSLFRAAAIGAAILGVGCTSLAETRVEVSPNQDMLDWKGSSAQAENAMRRWAPKAGETYERVKRGWSPRLMAFPTKNCIQLWPKGPGGTPIYCYRANSLELLEEYSDTE